VRAAGRFLGAAAAGVAAYSLLVEPRWFRTRREKIPGVLRLPTDRSLRVLVVADLHHSPPAPSLDRQLLHLANEDVDLVIAAGDLLGARDAEDATVDLLEPLVRGGVPGVAVLGSNDLFAPSPKSPYHYFRPGGMVRPGPRLDTKRLRKGLDATGWTLLEDERCVLETRLGPIEIAGLRDPHLPTARLPQGDEITARDPEAIARIGIVHAPYVGPIDYLIDSGYSLVVCGHTHGGQVRVPGVGALTANSDLPLGRARGTSPWGNAWLHVSAGLGQSRYAPFRFACRPEASILEIS
jgi:uncharacterized protein